MQLSRGRIPSPRISAGDERFGPAPRQKILAVIGTRPEAIKMAPIIKELQAHPLEFETLICSTAQHRSMLDQMLAVFDLRPDHDLDVMTHGQSVTGVASAVMLGLEKVIREDRPDWVLVQGDTTTAMAATVAAFHERVHVGHVEAGLRTHDLHSPFPEEGNRKVTGTLAELHFAPTAAAAENLYAEGVPPEAVVVTGNTVIDALNHTRGGPFDPEAAGLGGLDLSRRRLALVTAHRRENHGQPMERIGRGLRAVAERHAEDLQLVCPVHLNPKAGKPLRRHLGGLDNVLLVPPLDYRALVWLLDKCHFVMTDSGGLQEEAAGLGRPVLVLRDDTERPEGVDCGIATLVGSDPQRIRGEAEVLMTNTDAYRRRAIPSFAYGDGRAARRIAASLAAHGHTTQELVHGQTPFRRFARRRREYMVEIPSEQAAFLQPTQ